MAVQQKWLGRDNKFVVQQTAESVFNRVKDSTFKRVLPAGAEWHLLFSVVIWSTDSPAIAFSLYTSSTFSFCGCTKGSSLLDSRFLLHKQRPLNLPETEIGFSLNTKPPGNVVSPIRPSRSSRTDAHCFAAAALAVLAGKGTRGLCSERHKLANAARSRVEAHELQIPQAADLTRN